MKMKLWTKIAMIITILIIIITGLVAYEFSDDIYLFYRDTILKPQNNIVLKTNNYYKNNSYSYVQITNNFTANKEQDLLNIIYTIINSGQNSFTFYCNKKYKLCINNLESIMSNQDILSNINNFVHPYNSFKKITANYDKYGKITLKIEKLYNDNEIKEINDYIDNVIKDNKINNLSDEQKIIFIHDYIINNGKYDTDNNSKAYNKANNILIDGKGICSAYADALAIFLNKFNIDNYKIASKNHIWNLVKLNNNWLHVDLTWDDPVSTDGKNYLEKNTLLITNKRLKQIDNKEHNFNESIYVEGK